MTDAKVHTTQIPLTRNGEQLSLTLNYNPLKVYAPAAYSSVLLVRNLTVSPDDVALDIGTGTGVYAISTALLGAQKVLALDLSSDALATAAQNAENNGVREKIEFRQAQDKNEMFGPVQPGERFSLITSNPPCLPDPGAFEMILPGTIMLSGSDGSHHASVLLEEAPQYLTPEGRVVFVYPSTSNPRKIFGLLDRDYHYHILAQIEIPFYLHFLELWDYLRQLRDLGLSDWHERAGVPYRTYWLIEARPKAVR